MTKQMKTRLLTTAVTGLLAAGVTMAKMTPAFAEGDEAKQKAKTDKSGKDSCKGSCKSKNGCKGKKAHSKKKADPEVQTPKAH